MPVSITVGPFDETGLIRTGSLSAQVSLGSRTTCNFAVTPNAGLWVPLVGEPVVIERDGTRLFAGFVWSVSRRRIVGVELDEADVTCVDNTYIADRRTAGEREWASAKSGDIVRDIIANDLASEGVSDLLVTDGPDVESFAISGYPTVTEALDSLAQLTAMRWYIDENAALRWFSDLTLGYSAPFAITGDNVTAVSALDSMEDYANRIILRLPQGLRDAATETFDSAHASYPTDGSRTQFGLPYPCASTPTVTVDGVAVTVGVSGVDTGKDWYWSQGSQWITQDAGGTALTSSQVLAVTYVGVDQLFVETQNDGQINERQAVEGGTGYHVRTFDLAKQLTRADAQAAADAILDQYDDLPAVIEYTTNTYLEPLADLIRPGMKQAVAVVGISNASPPTEYVVRSVRFQDRERWPDHIEVIVELMRGPMLQDMAGLLGSLGAGNSGGAGVGVAAGQMLTIGAAVETPDGDRTAFTFTPAPRFIVYNGQLLRTGSAVTISGDTATFTLAPESGADIFSLS